MKAITNQVLNRWLLVLIPLTFVFITPWSLSEAALWAGYGKHLWNHWHFLYQDTTSLLPTDNNTTSAWLLSLIYWGLFQLGGLFAVAHFHHVLLIVLLVYIYRRSIWKNPWPWRWQERLPIYLLWLGAGAFFSPRPALVAFLPFIASFELLDRRAQEKKPLSLGDGIFLVLLEVLWVNLHGSFVLLLLMTCWYCIFFAQKWKSSLLILASLLLGSLVNPFGWHIYPYILKTSSFSRELGISEWLSPFSFEYPTQFFCYWGLWIVLFLLALRSFKSGNLFYRSPLVSLMFLPLNGLRLSAFPLLVFPLFLSHWFLVYKDHRTERHDRFQPAFFLVALGLVSVAIMFSPYMKNEGTHFKPQAIAKSFDDSNIFSISHYLQNSQNQSCGILNDFNVGHFLLLYAPQPHLIDGRVTPYTEEALHSYQKLMQGNDADAWIEKYHPCYVILSQSRSAFLVESIKKNHAFKEVMVENDYILLEKARN